MQLKSLVILCMIVIKVLAEIKQANYETRGPLAFLPIPGGCSLHPVKNRGGVLLRVLIKTSACFSLGTLHL